MDRQRKLNSVILEDFLKANPQNAGGKAYDPKTNTWKASGSNTARAEAKPMDPLWKILPDFYDNDFMRFLKFYNQGEV